MVESWRDGMEMGLTLLVHPGLDGDSTADVLALYPSRRTVENPVYRFPAQVVASPGSCQHHRVMNYTYRGKGKCLPGTLIFVCSYRKLVLERCMPWFATLTKKNVVRKVRDLYGVVASVVQVMHYKSLGSPFSPTTVMCCGAGPFLTGSSSHKNYGSLSTIFNHTPPYLIEKII